MSKVFQKYLAAVELALVTTGYPTSDQKGDRRLYLFSRLQSVDMYRKSGLDARAVAERFHAGYGNDLARGDIWWRG